jgi:hypothetical protein
MEWERLMGQSRSPMARRQLLKTCLFFAVNCTFSYGQAAANPGMTIHVYDYAGVEPGVLAEAEALAARTLHKAGLRTQWSNCRASPTTRCAAVGGVNHLYVRLLPEAMAGKLAASTRMLGMSLLTSGGTFPVDAYVFAERVGVLAEQDRHAVPPLLGAAITHEVGHLLLAGNAHTVTGIMSAQWGPKEKKDSLMGVLTFSRSQSEQMRVDVSQRMSGSNQRPHIAYNERVIEPMRDREHRQFDARRERRPESKGH